MAYLTVSISIPLPSLGPPIKLVGTFAGNSSSGMTIVKISEPVLRAVSARCNVTPSFIPVSRFWVQPALRYSSLPILASIRR